MKERKDDEIWKKKEVLRKLIEVKKMMWKKGKKENK